MIARLGCLLLDTSKNIAELLSIFRAFLATKEKQTALDPTHTVFVVIPISINFRASCQWSDTHSLFSRHAPIWASPSPLSKFCSSPAADISFAKGGWGWYPLDLVGWRASWSVVSRARTNSRWSQGFLVFLPILLPYSTAGDNLETSIQLYKGGTLSPVQIIT